MENTKHAYLIMAHHRFDILKEILEDLDDFDNDIFLHVDIKNKDFNSTEIRKVVKHANLIFTKRMNVHWGGFSQIQCILMLLETATNYRKHVYYHFMVGVEFPLRSQEFIHDFFAKHQGYEFIGFDNNDSLYLDRIRYYHPFNEYARNNNFWQKILNKIRIYSVEVQNIFNVNLIKNKNIIVKKGSANWSITQDLVDYIIENKNLINKLYKHSFCGDELFIHTLVYNSRFWDKVYDKTDEYHSSMRMHTWEDPHNQYHLQDVEMLVNSGRLFARKIDGEDALEVIRAIKEKRRKIEL